MTVTGDAQGRLAQGRPMVDDFDEYVRACQHLGFSHPDLTARAGQVHDLYATEDGLRLDALSADADTLAMISQVTDHVAQRQSELVATLTAAWSGRGAGSALEFLARNQHAATTVGAAVRDAAQTLRALRDELWNAVDAKVAATLAMDTGRRSDWLAAARTVTSGAGDRSTASELIDQQVKPFVHDVIGTQWVGAMRSHTAAVEAAYRTALARLAAGGGLLFEIPGQLGPLSAELGPPVDTVSRVESVGAASVTPSASAPPAAVVPASFSAPPPSPSPTSTEMPASQPLSTPSVTPGAASPLGDLGALGSGSPASGLSGFGQQLSDLIGGLLGDAADDTTAAESHDLDDADEDDADEDDADEDDDTGDDDTEDDPEDEEADAEGGEDDETRDDAMSTDPAVVDPAVAEPKPPPPSPAATTVSEPASTPLPPPPNGAEEVAPPPAEPTPCEIAADELPHVGE